MKRNYLLHGKTGKKLYARVKDLPIIDYHCHLPAAEILADKPFDNIGRLWLGGDHYKWRLMRQAGVEERLITGDASDHDKFIAYAGALSLAAGSPLYHWSQMELSLYFGIDEYLNADNAERIWQKANENLRAGGLSPRKMLSLAKVEALCTTDDIADDLACHRALREDPSFKVRVLPSFRADTLFRFDQPGWREYVDKLSAAAGVQITDLKSLKEALAARLKHFVANGCRFTDVGIPDFPDRIAAEPDADEAFRLALSGQQLEREAYLGLLGNLYLFLGKLYKEAGLTMQWHLSVIRDASPALYASLGHDCGGDCVGDAPSARALTFMLGALEQADALPRTVIYSLSAASCETYATVCGSFRGVSLGAAWWFCDHKRGIEKQLDVIAEQGGLSEFLGMLTDSRSFLSYARHDYFRRILCEKIGGWVDAGEFDGAAAGRLAEKICYENIKKLAGE